LRLAIRSRHHSLKPFELGAGPLDRLPQFLAEIYRVHVAHDAFKRLEQQLAECEHLHKRPDQISHRRRFPNLRDS
jgi:hypothetical protein